MTQQRRYPAPPAGSTPAPALARGPQGAQGAQGPSGTPGDSLYRSELESGTSSLFGMHPQGFARLSDGGDYIECVFTSWGEGDLLRVEFFAQVLSLRQGSLLIEAQVSTDGGDTWHGITGARSHMSAATHSTAASSSVEIASGEPRVRLFVSQYGLNTVDYGSGPEGSTLVLRCTQIRAGAFRPLGHLSPPRH